MKREFNTGRHYGPEGQLIRWVWKDGVAYFYDVTRMCCGKFNYNTFIDTLGGYAALEHAIMFHYDRNTHDILDIWEFEPLWND